MLAQKIARALCRFSADKYNSLSLLTLEEK